MTPANVGHEAEVPATEVTDPPWTIRKLWSRRGQGQGNIELKGDVRLALSSYIWEPSSGRIIQSTVRRPQRTQESSDSARLVTRPRKVIREPALGERHAHLGRDLVGTADGSDVGARGGEDRLEACTGGAVVGFASSGADAAVTLGRVSE
jgi:hypothetical protein